MAENFNERSPEVLTEQDEADIHRLYSEPDGIPEPSFHPVLKVWKEVLAVAERERATSISPQWASKIVGSYVGLSFADCLEVHERYFDKLIQLRDILYMEIDGDPDCLTYTTPEEDAAENSHHYKNVLTLWQMAVLQWELDWDCADPMAAGELAAISEVHKIFFGNAAQPGMTAYLDNIGFQFTDADQQEMVEALEELKAGAGE